MSDGGGLGKVITGMAVIGAWGLLSSSSSFALDQTQIISSSAEAYAASRRTYLTNYIIVGVHYSGQAGKNCGNKLARISPKNTEAIVDYRLSVNGKKVECYGTALVPRQAPNRYRSRWERYTI